MAKIRSADGCVHFSELRHMQESPAHYRYACERKREVSRPMIVGSVADAIVFEHRRIAVFDGVRRGKEWEAFKALHSSRGDRPGDLICSRSEYEDAEGAAKAALADPVAGPIIRRKGVEYQRVMRWKAWGLDCAAGIAGEGGRGGFDIIGDDYIDDLKVTADASPRALERQVLAMSWHAQGAWYVDGAKALGLGEHFFRLICVEASPPHPVVVVELLPQLLELGRRSLSMWTERLKQCEAAGEWPGYVQEEIEMGVPSWLESA